MRDEIDARLWSEHHQTFSIDIRRLASGAMQTFELLHRHYWNAPWSSKNGEGSVEHAPRGKHILAAVAIMFSLTAIVAAVGPTGTSAEFARSAAASHYRA